MFENFIYKNLEDFFIIFFFISDGASNSSFKISSLGVRKGNFLLQS